MVRIELDADQVLLLLGALDALSESAEEEKKLTNDPDIIYSCDSVVEKCAGLYKYIGKQGGCLI